jgi:DNA-binding NtrC family response regulator
MPGSFQVLILESDANALVQMRRVLAGMGASAITAVDEAGLAEASGYLQSKRHAPVLIVARVTLPSGSGIRLLEQAAEIFPDSRHLLISHHPQHLLMMVPGFADHCGHFLQEAFTDEQFRAAVEDSLASALRAG